MDAVYRLDGDEVDTSAHAARPWGSATQHGSAPAALVARLAEVEPSLTPMRLARISLDLLRLVTIARLRHSVRQLKRARKGELQQIRWFAGEAEVSARPS
jgi:hypothetical protein